MVVYLVTNDALYDQFLLNVGKLVCWVRNSELLVKLRSRHLAHQRSYLLETLSCDHCLIYFLLGGIFDFPTLVAFVFSSIYCFNVA